MKYVFPIFCLFCVFLYTPARPHILTAAQEIPIARGNFLFKQTGTLGGTWFSSHLCCANICGRRLAQSYVGAILDASRGLRLLMIAQSFTGWLLFPPCWVSFCVLRAGNRVDACALDKAGSVSTMLTKPRLLSMLGATVPAPLQL